MSNEPLTVSQLAEALGRQDIADACGVGLTAVSNAVTRGAFPSSWFLAMKLLAAPKGVECPTTLFKMKHVPHNVDVTVIVQDAETVDAATLKDRAPR